MVTEKRLTMRKGIPFILIGLSIFFLYLYFFVGIAEIAAIIRGVNLFYLLAAVVTLLSTTFYSLTWHYLLKLLSVKTTFRKTFLFVWVGIFIDILIPAESVSGDISTAYLMSKSTNEDVGKIAASIVSRRIISMAVTLGGLIISSVFLILKYPLPALVLDFIIIVIIYSAISTVLLCYLCFREPTTSKILNWMTSLVERLSRGHWKMDRLKIKAQKMLSGFHREVKNLGREPKRLIQPVIFNLMTWFFDVLILLLVFASINFGVPFFHIVIVYSLTITVQAIPVGVPAEIGLTDIVMTTLYTLLGIPLTVSAAATVLTRVLTVWFRFFIGYVSVQWVGIKALKGDIRQPE